MSLSAKAFETLLVLVENSGHLVTKDELIQALWPNTFVEEGNLTQNISILRKSLGGSRNGEQYIKTVPKVGYRFVAEVREFREQEAGCSALDRATSDELTQGDQKRNSSSLLEVASKPVPEITNENNRPAGDSRWIGKVTSHREVLLALAAVAMAALTTFYFVLNGRQNHIDSVAVLPFTVVSAPPDTEYLADGIAESIISNLTQLPNLKVTSFASVARYKGRQIDDVQVLGKQFGVRAVLSTRVIQRGDELSINTELVDTKDYRRIWGQHYNRKLSNIIGLQEEVATDISEKLQARLTAEERGRLTKRYTENAEAYRLYLQGRYFWNRRTGEGQKKAFEHFQKAAAVDPNYSLAYAGLADCYLLGFLPIPSAERMPKAREAAIRALQLDETLGEAHTSLGLVKARFEWDWPGAEKEFKRAIELNSSYATAHERYGRFLMWVGRKQEAIKEILQAQQLDPISLIINTNVAEVFYFARDYDRAIVELRKVIEMDPNFLQAHRRLAEAYEQKGMDREALAEYLKWMSLSGVSRENVDAHQRAYESSGIRGFWKKQIGSMEHDARESYISSRRLARMYARLGEKDQALAGLEKACRDRDMNMVELKVDPAFDSLRSEPRFMQLLHLTGLAP